MTQKAAPLADSPQGQLFRLLGETTPDVIVQSDLAGTRLYVSPACRAYGWEPEELIGGNGGDLVHPEDRERLISNTATLLREGQPDPDASRELRFRRKDGTWVWFEGNPAVLRDGEGRPTSVVNIFRDISRHKALEAELAAREDQLRRLADTAADLIVHIDAEDRISFATNASRHYGYRPEELIGRSRRELIHLDDLERLDRALEAALAGGGEVGAQDREYRVRTKAGDWVWVESNYTLLYDAQGARMGGVSVIRDLTLRRAMEAGLHEALAEAEAAAEAKAAFLANMTHELRTPLTSIVGFAQLAAAQADVSAVTRDYLDRIAEATRALLSVVNDILDFSKLEAGQATVRPEPVDLEPFLRRTLDLFAPQAAAKDLALQIACDPPAGAQVLIDPDRVRQVLLNLVGNAVKFTGRGGVTLSAAYDPDGERLRVQVADTGVGISPEDQARLFRRFAQVDGARDRSDSTGLGLSICKGVVELMGGEIGCDSAAGQGSRFWFWLPAARVDTPAAASGVAEPTMGLPAQLRVLVADDHEANRRLVRLFLAGVGAEVTEAEDGEAAAALAAERPFDVILMDRRMPRLDGPGAVRRIRRSRGPNRATPVLAFTADADALDHMDPAEAREIQGVIAKPIDPATLIRTIAEAVAAAPDRAA